MRQKQHRDLSAILRQSAPTFIKALTLTVKRKWLRSLNGTGFVLKVPDSAYS